MKIKIASALTKPVTTERETNRINEPNFKYPAPICSTPVKSVAANRYSKPCSRTKVTINNAIAPVAADIRKPLVLNGFEHKFQLFFAQ